MGNHEDQNDARVARECRRYNCEHHMSSPAGKSILLCTPYHRVEQFEDDNGICGLSLSIDSLLRVVWRLLTRVTARRRLPLGLTS